MDCANNITHTVSEESTTAGKEDHLVSELCEDVDWARHGLISVRNDNGRSEDEEE
jgi:hypothetical protein